MKKIIFAFFYCLSFYSKGNCQSLKNLGFGIQIGKTSSYAPVTFTGNYFIKPNLDWSVGIGQSEFQGFGFGSMISYSPFYNQKRMNLVCGINYTHYLNYKINDYSETFQFASYKILGTNYLVPSIGLRRDFKSESGHLLSIRAALSYRFSNAPARLLESSGTPDPKFIKYINNDLDNVWGANIYFIVKINYDAEDWKSWKWKDSK
ncbi:MAG: hypothetical protein CFE21_10530 [Bacteroidetes bacterium B1(2017)]|nr:MAG: hypothetical protein CFE21_10530 [Bacteroidetes bacterium B1(2017)]